MIARFLNIPEIYQYPLFTKKEQHITNTPKKFFKDKLDLEINEDPIIQINDKSVIETSKKFRIKDV